MTDAERKDAIERVREYRRRVKAEEHFMDATVAVYGRVDDREHSPSADDNLVIDGYLADHPADDAEPVTVGWLKAIAPGPFRQGVGWPLNCDASGGPVLYCSCGVPGVTPEWYLAGHNRLLGLPDQHTRGDVCRLLAALGVPHA